MVTEEGIGEREGGKQLDSIGGDLRGVNSFKNRFYCFFYIIL